MIQMKTCSKCRIEQSLENYSKDQNGKFKKKSSCKSCQKKYDKIQKKEYRIRNKVQIALKNKVWRSENLEKIKAKKKKYQEENKEEISSRRKLWKQENRDYLRKYMNKINSERRKTNPLYRLKCNIKRLILLSFKNKGLRKNSKTSQILGCSFEEFKIHIEKQFVDGMNWENRSKWHIDHIMPLASGKTEEEIIKLNHYTNLRPLWAEDNMKKGAKIG